MPRLIIDRNKCKGYGVCVAICPQIFQLDSEQKAKIISEDYAGCDYERAIASCPVQAISIEED